MQIKQLFLISTLILPMGGTASAQAPPAPTTPPAQTAPPATERAQNDCAPAQIAPQQGTTQSEGNTVGQNREPLGDKLARSNGVLCPPTGVDPEIRAPTPNTGDTAIIPPPGSLGGDPTVRSK